MRNSKRKRNQSQQSRHARNLAIDREINQVLHGEILPPESILSWGDGYIVSRNTYYDILPIINVMAKRKMLL